MVKKVEKKVVKKPVKKVVKKVDKKFPYVIVRTYSAGVFAGEMVKRKGREVELINARRIWKWAGAASLSQLCMEGVKIPSESLFPCEVNKVLLLEAVEILDVTKQARESIKNVPIWAAK